MGVREDARGVCKIYAFNLRFCIRAHEWSLLEKTAHCPLGLGNYHILLIVVFCHNRQVGLLERKKWDILIWLNVLE